MDGIRVAHRSSSCHPVTRNGKQIMVNGHHWADCENEHKALVTQSALENYFCHCKKGA